MWQAISYYGALALESFFGTFGVRLYEEPRYEVIDRVADRVEIRQYGQRVAAETQIAIASEAGNNQAFKLLFAYITGANQISASGKIAMSVSLEVRNNALIAMTVPVQTAQQNGKTVMRFYLPAKYSRDRAPEPADAQVKIVLVPAETVAVVRFSGSGEDFATHQTELLEMLRGSRWRPTGAPYTLYYDAPFTLLFLRRNEAAVPVIENL
jgi:hypothetical protein